MGFYYASPTVCCFANLDADFDSYSQFNVYQILKVLGEGGFGKVLLGKHKVTGELYAIKVIDSG